MIIDRDGNIAIITQETATVKTLVHNIEQAYDTYKNDHLIVNLSSLDKITLEDIIEFNAPKTLSEFSPSGFRRR